MSDIVTWLRERVWTDDPPKLDEAADEIERLRAELANAYALNGAVSESLYQTTVERDALRELLREARDALSWVWPKEMLARIDAALKGDGDGSSADAG